MTIGDENISTKQKGCHTHLLKSFHDLQQDNFCLPPALLQIREGEIPERMFETKDKAPVVKLWE